MRFNVTELAKSVCCAAALCAVSLTANAALSLEKQREVYEQAQNLLDKNDINGYLVIRPKIADYPLTPYVDYRTFIRQLPSKSPKQVNDFISEYETFPFSRRVSAPYLNHLYKEKDWKAITEFQKVIPSGERYQCIFYQANLKQGKQVAAFKGAEDMWLSGSSIASECDPLFSAWDKAGGRTDDLILQRMLLAFDARNGSLISYLQKLPKSAKAKQQAQDMKALFDKPATVAEFAKKKPANDFNRAQSQYALEKLARMNIEQAQQAYDSVVKGQKFSPEKAQSLADYIAFRLTRTESASLAKWRDDKTKTSQDLPLIETRIRLAVQNADWKGVQEWIAVLNKEEQATLRWQYWLGRSEIALGDDIAGKKRLATLVGERNFYSVAAANAIGQSIKYPSHRIKLDIKAVQPYHDALARISEMIATDKISAAKSEWAHLLRRVNKDDKAMLAAYASSKHWHHLTVTASIQAQMWDNIELRFPVAHQWWFNFYAKKHDIDPVTMMSLARQESALDVEARSPVGARGIMQIMPETAKYTARKYKLKYQGTEELYNVGKNIEIGSHYLQGLLEDYDNNRIFALAAYNAGPNRVKTWRERTQGKVDAYAFIEAIPFKETRGYVQNILMFETYYRDLLGIDGAFLNQHEINTKY
ncbi:murein transglycosylase [Vibrio natriegens]|uniref:Lytic murein transglycosylase n=1 Tax=Vibrio natriegens NBRC 15636 = ATCC 14048 = DSM 759 TaxID=1219067 RepID=A0AAN0Y0S0_VIBNA|nr:murein transglycosylase [Vibrio natriegens]ALR16424.1 lytic murein transglycosylase [Vibrio natriegens NBRC 15636 = ATCC 14048 = DSM 759]ANQ11711.1 lytic murein transglycosylase [Vibrio natriegens NBRC 15636 = ATCC 14048 = DSM 759]EPM39270.1 lytic murein transglycosylase [Vibrio natriegens NBRC 15636 = ATCC 14048 = DSM 759]MDX6026053.1 murein transglycosylase [Vibrio natriegens NBRC 15636 = ATCC 14048 = DSM 759]UUI12162.1 murein transglycosylase [Vibrio natriegens]